MFQIPTVEMALRHVFPYLPNVNGPRILRVLQRGFDRFWRHFTSGFGASEPQYQKRVCKNVHFWDFWACQNHEKREGP